MSRPDAILILENNLESVYLLEKAFRSCGANHLIHIARYHKEASLYLDGIGVYSNRQKYPWPCAILMDIVHDHANAFEFIQWVRARQIFDQVPIIVLVEDERDPWIQTAFDFGANAYLIKTTGLNETTQMLRSLKVMDEVLSRTRLLNNEPASDTDSDSR